MSKDIFTFDQFAQHQPLGKPYYVLTPASKHELYELAMYANPPMHVSFFFEKVQDESDDLIVMSAVKIGQTQEGDDVMIVMRADGQVARMRLGRWFIAVCDPAGGKAQLKHDMREDLENTQGHRDLHELYGGVRRANR